MRNQFTLFALLCVLAACNPDKKRKVDPENIRFATTESSELFFRNMRQTYYEKLDDTQTKLEQYRISQRPSIDAQPYPYLCIVNNWRYDEAYILVEPNAFLQGRDSILVHWQDTVSQQGGTYRFGFGNKDTHFIFATQLYNSMLAQHQLFLEEKGEKLPFLSQPDEREAFRITMMDYYRLVGLF